MSAIKTIEVKRRPYISTSGYTSDPKVKVLPVLTETMKPHLPSIQQLVYDIYDYQKRLISAVSPKRYTCNTPTPTKVVETLYNLAPNKVLFDGMSHATALEYYRPEAEKIGLRNSFCVPFMFAQVIAFKSNSFKEGNSFIFELKDGMRHMTQCTQQEFNWLTSKRQIISNLSSAINNKYNCNLNMAYDDAVRVFEATGVLPEHNRDYFTRACDFYVNPQMLSLVDFIRCNIPSLRRYDDRSIEILLQQHEEKIVEIDADLANEIKYTKLMYTGEVLQWVGDFSHEPVYNF